MRLGPNVTRTPCGDMATAAVRVRQDRGAAAGPSRTKVSAAQRRARAGIRRRNAAPATPSAHGANTSSGASPPAARARHPAPARPRRPARPGGDPATVGRSGPRGGGAGARGGAPRTARAKGVAAAAAADASHVAPERGYFSGYIDEYRPPVHSVDLDAPEAGVAWEIPMNGAAQAAAELAAVARRVEEQERAVMAEIRQLEQLPAAEARSPRNDTRETPPRRKVAGSRRPSTGARERAAAATAAAAGTAKPRQTPPKGKPGAPRAPRPQRRSSRRKAPSKREWVSDVRVTDEDEGKRADERRGGGFWAAPPLPPTPPVPPGPHELLADADPNAFRRDEAGNLVLASPVTAPEPETVRVQRELGIVWMHDIDSFTPRRPPAAAVAAAEAAHQRAREEAARLREQRRRERVARTRQRGEAARREYLEAQEQARLQRERIAARQAAYVQDALSSDRPAARSRVVRALTTEFEALDTEMEAARTATRAALSQEPSRLGVPPRPPSPLRSGSHGEGGTGRRSVANSQQRSADSDEELALAVAAEVAREADEALDGARSEVVPRPSASRGSDSDGERRSTVLVESASVRVGRKGYEHAVACSCGSRLLVATTG